MTRRLSVVLALLSLSSGHLPAQAPEPEPGIRIREGFELSVVQAELRRPRFLCFDGDVLYVSQPHDDRIVSCRDGDGDGYYEITAVFVQGHRQVHAMYLYEGWLWFAETGAILRARDTDGDGRADETETIIPPGELPAGGMHWQRSLAVRDGRIYTSIGDSGNIVDETDTDRQKIHTFALDGSDKRLFCTGIRNNEKLMFRPGTDELWGMDHGSDWFGRPIESRRPGSGQPITDRHPPDEMNLYAEGAFYGHPFIVGDRLPRYEFLDREDIVELAAQTTAPQWLTGAHWSPNAMCFYTGEQFPADHRGDAFVAYHGSWNRSPRDGYCVTRVLFDDGKPYGELIYVDFLADSQVLGRPVDVVVAPDGSLIFSDDYRHRLYRLRYVGDRQQPGSVR